MLDAIADQLKEDGLEFFTASDIHQVLEVVEKYELNAVIIGAGLDIDTRCEIIKYVAGANPSTTIHMKDWNSGKEGMLPFIQGIISRFN